MFDVFGRTGPPTLGAAILDPKKQKCCNQMRFASIQCSKMRLRPGLRPGPRYRELTALPQTPQLVLRGTVSRREGEHKGKEGEGEGRGREGKERRGTGRERKGREG